MTRLALLAGLLFTGCAPYQAEATIAHGTWEVADESRDVIEREYADDLIDEIVDECGPSPSRECADSVQPRVRDRWQVAMDAQRAFAAAVDVYVGAVLLAIREDISGASAIDELMRLVALYTELIPVTERFGVTLPELPPIVSAYILEEAD